MGAFSFVTAIWGAGPDLTTQTSTQKMMFGHALLAQQALTLAIPTQALYTAGPVALSGVRIGAAATQEGKGVPGTEATPTREKVQKGGEGALRVLETAATGGTCDKYQTGLGDWNTHKFKLLSSIMYARAFTSMTTGCMYTMRTRLLQ